MNVQLFDEAIEELNAIYRHIAVYNEKSAVNVFNSILDEIEKLKDFPNMGKIHTMKLRVWIVQRRYYIVYFYDKDTVYIVLIWDCRRNPEEFRQNILKSLGQEK